MVFTNVHRNNNHSNEITRKYLRQENLIANDNAQPIIHICIDIEKEDA